MSEGNSEYRQIVKATSLFGGVQVFNILISIIRSKSVAILLGPTGMGIMGLLNAMLDIISSLTNFGLGSSAVKDIALAHGTNDEKRVVTVVNVLRKLVWVTGVLGLIVTAFLSPWLSQFTFGEKSYTMAFFWISISLLFRQLTNGQLAVLQGMRQLKYLAMANLIGSAVGLFLTIPLYYFWGLDGIVPGIICTSLLSLLLSWYYTRKVKIERIKIPIEKTFKEGKNMLHMGFLISLSGLLNVLTAYLVRIYVGRIGGMDQVGLYNAGFAIITTYVGLIFSAMATDYYPRLSAVAHDNNLCKRTINQQSEIAILILAPILIIFLVFINWVVLILYSKQFLPINEMIYWAALGMFFKAISWSICFIFLAKGHNKIYFWSELTVNLYMLGLNILGYYFFGLKGLGLSFAVSYFLFLCQVYVISKFKFDFNLDNKFIKIFIIQFSLALICFGIKLYIVQPYNYFFGIILIGLSGIYSFKELDKRLNIKQLYAKIIRK